MKRIFTIIFLLHVSLFLSCFGGEEDGAVQYGYVLPEIYHTPAEVDAFLYEINSNYPSITHIESVGYSIEGREIKSLVISGNPGVAEDEPRIRLTGGIHGNEMISVEILLNFIAYLTSEYAKKNPEIESLVNARSVAVIPVLNPDGLAKGRRYNSKGVDLNRNFDTLSEPESSALSAYSIKRVFHASITYHSGAVLLNMPFDYGSATFENIKPVEDALVRDMALSYTGGGFSSNPDVFTKVYNSEFNAYVNLVEGTINGGDWYKITGSLQDWSYKETGCVDMTVEVARSNPLTVEGIDNVYMYNRNSLIAYIKKAGYGVHGRVTDSSGNPVPDVQVSISGGDIITRTDSNGFYHRILLPGTYTLKFSKGSFEKTASDVIVPNDPAGTPVNISNF